MYFHALIPFRPVNPKTRLSGVLSEEEREEFAQVMLGDVIYAVRRTGCTATLLCTSKYECRDALVAIRREGLNEAINWALPQFHCPALIIMSDLPMVTPGSLQRVVSTKADLAIVPGLGGGTNILFIKNPVYRMSDIILIVYYIHTYHICIFHYSLPHTVILIQEAQRQSCLYMRLSSEPYSSADLPSLVR